MKDIIKLRRQAETAVSDMKEGPLREKAFEVILSHLLQGNGKIESHPSRISSKVKHLPPKTTDRAGKTDGPMGRVSQLIEEGFFKKAKSIADARAELRNRGHNYPVTTLSPILVRLTRKRALRRTREKLDGRKLSFAYSNW